MKIKKLLKEIGKGVEIAAPIAAQFGVPGAQTVNEAIMLIHGDPSRPNDDAIALLGAHIDHVNSKKVDDNTRQVAPIRTPSGR